MLLADAGNLDVPVEVPAEQVCMHFFPGSRVNIQGQPAQQVGLSPFFRLRFYIESESKLFFNNYNNRLSFWVPTNLQTELDAVSCEACLCCADS